MVKDVAAVILAGGKSRRFGGKQKSRIVVDGIRIIDRIMNVMQQVFEEIIIVTNDPLPFAELQNVVLISDIIPLKGPAGGIHAGLSSARAEAVFVYGADMPFPDKLLIMEEMQLFKMKKPLALVPVIDKLTEPLHAVYSKKLIPLLEEFLTQENPPPMADFFSRFNTEYFSPSDPGAARIAFTNVNTPGDLEKISKKF